MVRLVHFSDIHFSNKNSGAGFDPDEDVRREVLRDLKTRVEKDGPCDAILVTGDIAYAGKKEEYDIAGTWLEEARAIAGCQEKMIFLCPGNHDVDRDVHKANSMIRDTHLAIMQNSDVVSFEDALQRRLTQDHGARMLFAPLTAYNEFAVQYGSSFYTGDEFCLQEDLRLNDGSSLRIRSMNSALLSFDNGDQHKLFLGSRAWTMPREDGVVYLAMAHHPPTWLFDEAEAESGITDRALIHLFGHEHRSRVHRERHWCRIYAGSINPHRKEPQWKPGYNILDVQVDVRDSNKRFLTVKVDVREWALVPEAKFQTLKDRDGQEYWEAEYPLDGWTPPEPITTIALDTTDSNLIEKSEPNFVTDDVAARTVVGKFFQLTLSERNIILGELDLFTAETSNLPDFERQRRALEKAREKGLFPELRDKLNAMETEE